MTTDYHAPEIPQDPVLREMHAAVGELLGVITRRMLSADRTEAARIVGLLQEAADAREPSDRMLDGWSDHLAEAVRVEAKRLGKTIPWLFESWAGPAILSTLVMEARDLSKLSTAELRAANEKVMGLVPGGCPPTVHEPQGDPPCHGGEEAPCYCGSCPGCENRAAAVASQEGGE